MTRPGPKPSADRHMEIECPCGVRFKIYKCRLNNQQGGTRKYCSRECSQRFSKKVRYQFHKVVVS